MGRGDEECTLPDAVSEIRCRRAKETPGNDNRIIIKISVCVSFDGLHIVR